MKIASVVKSLVLGSVLLFASVEAANAAGTRCETPRVRVHGCATPRYLGSTTDRASHDLLVLAADGRWVAVQPGYVQQIGVRTDASGRWYWKCGPCGPVEQSRVCTGSDTSLISVLWTPADCRRITWWAWSV